MRFAAQDSFWYAPLPDDAPIHPDSAVNAPRLARQFRYSCAGSGLTPTIPQGAYSPTYQVIFNQASYSTELWVVDSTTVPPVKVQWLTSNGKGKPATDTSGNGLQALLDTVPLPPDPSLQLASSGSDGACAVYDVATDTLYEFWQLRRDAVAPADGVTYPWSCSYAGVLKGASQSSGIFPHGWGASASGGSVTAALIKLDEIAAGVIPHAVTCAIPVTGAGVYAPFPRHDTLTLIPAAQPVVTTVGKTMPAGTWALTFASTPPTDTHNRTWVINPGGTTQETVTARSINKTSVAQLTSPTVHDHAKGEPVKIATTTDRVNEGAFFRFPADVVIPDALTPTTRALMVAIRDHGMYVSDSSGVVGFGVEGTRSLGTPYQSAGLTANTINTGAERKYLQQIPWEQLQQIKIA